MGYFYSSGFHAIYQSLENTEKIRILIGISTSRQTFELLENAKRLKQQQIDFSHAETKQEVENLVQKEMEDSEDNRKVEEGVNKFIEWAKNGKLDDLLHRGTDKYTNIIIDEAHRFRTETTITYDKLR